MPIRVSIIEDVKGFAETLRQYIAASGQDVECVSIHDTAEEALSDLHVNRPDVAVVDIHLPAMSGIELICRLKEARPEITCLVLTTYEDSLTIFNALKAGASGYLLKRASAKSIVEAIVEIHGGGSPMSPQIARRVVEFFHERLEEDPLDQLSFREKEVLQLLSDGLSYKEIAQRINISFSTVRFHLHKIYDKLHVHSRGAATVKYLGRKKI